MLFRLVPELFVHEINKLDERDKLMFKKREIGFKRADGDQLEIDTRTNVSLNELAKDDFGILKEKAMNMEMYLFEQTQDMFALYEPLIYKEIAEGGHMNLYAYLTILEAMDDNVRKPWERRLWGEMLELRMINEDVQALRRYIRETDPPI